jgi:hypothetical protein
MARAHHILHLIAVVLFLSLTTLASGNESHRLWTIGTEDNSGAEFALAPNKYGEYTVDGLFVIGKSEQEPHVCHCIWPEDAPFGRRLSITSRPGGYAECHPTSTAHRHQWKVFRARYAARCGGCQCLR